MLKFLFAEINSDTLTCYKTLNIYTHLTNTLAYSKKQYLQSQILIDLSTEHEAKTFCSFGDHWMSSTESVWPTRGILSTIHVADESAETFLMSEILMISGQSKNTNLTETKRTAQFWSTICIFAQGPEKTISLFVNIKPRFYFKVK